MLRTQKALALSATLVALVSFMVVAAIVLDHPGAERQDCPGKIVCPQTGEQICRDKCPTVDASRADCLGRIVCPLTGKLVCKDRCPAKQDSVDSRQNQDKTPSCCSAKG